MYIGKVSELTGATPIEQINFSHVSNVIWRTSIGSAYSFLQKERKYRLYSKQTAYSIRRNALQASTCKKSCNLVTIKN
jgi:hypothetical protein